MKTHHYVPYLTNEAIQNLKKHEYRSIDKSYVSKYFLNHYWNLMMTFVPQTMAPNLITLLGFFAVFANFVLLIIYDRLLKGPESTLLLYSYGLSIFFYQTLDNLDGKQARKIKQSTPLGELFDHGLDALTCGLVVIIQCSAVGLGGSRLCLGVFGMSVLSFYFTTWEEYYTKILYLGYINGPTEGILVTVSTCFVSAYYGVSVWNYKMNYLIPGLISHQSIFNLKLKHFVGYVAISMSIVFQIASSVYSAHKACKKRRQSFMKAINNVAPVLTMFGSICYWVLSKNSVVYKKHPILFMTYWSVLFGYLATKVIVARITNMPFPNPTTLITPVIVGAIVINNGHYFFDSHTIQKIELYYVVVNFVVLMKIYLDYTFGVICEICKGLDINCLRLNKINND